MILPDSFKSFLIKNEIDVDVYLKQLQVDIPRYIRIHPKFRNDVDLEILKKEFGDNVTPVDWIPDFFALPQDISIASSEFYKKGKLYGMDVASAVAVQALALEPDDHVLDLCCAPGMKLLCVADLLQEMNGTGTVTGVDVSMHRLSNCKSLMRKYSVQKARLFCEDGTKFHVYAPSRVGKWVRTVHLETDYDNDDNVELETKSSSLIKGNLKKPFHATKLLRQQNDDHQIPFLYDKVLVDAECTHDGSIAHIKKYNDKQFSWEAFDDKVLDEERITMLQNLQRELIENGFKLLKRGGIMVYSTCSFSRFQNEDIVAWLLSKNPESARVMPVFPAESSVKAAPNIASQYAEPYPSMVHAVRLDPLHSETSGLFITKIMKL